MVEDRCSQVFNLDRIRPALVAAGLAEPQIRRPNVPIVSRETRQLAEEWIYRFLAATRLGPTTEHAALTRLAQPTDDDTTTELDQAAEAQIPSTAEVCALPAPPGLTVPGPGKLRPGIWDAWRSAHGI